MTIESFRTEDGRTLTYRREGDGPRRVCYFAHCDETARAYLVDHIAPERPNPDALKLFSEDIEGCGHLTFVEQPERFREEVTAFLS